MSMAVVISIIISDYFLQSIFFIAAIIVIHITTIIAFKGPNAIVAM